MMNTYRDTLTKRTLVCLCGLLNLLITSSIQAGQTDEFVVTNSNNAGPGSLRDAVAMANASSNDVDIRIDQSITNINITTGHLELTTGNEVLIRSIVSLTTINANSNSRVLTVTNPANSLILAGLHLTGGQTTANASLPVSCAPGTAHGGAVCTLGQLELSSMIISNNQTLGDEAHGGAIYAAGPIDIERGADIAGNSTNGHFADGGAIYAAGELDFGAAFGDELYLFENNHANGPSSRGGAVFSPEFRYPSSAATTSLTFVQNSASAGGALASSGCNPSGATDTSISGILFDSNSATLAGGAIYQSEGCIASIRSSEFTGNSCQMIGGGAIATEDRASISTSIFDGNSCIAPGGAIYGTTIELTDSNILRNNQTNGNGNHGGAIAAHDLLLANSTLAFNSTNAAAANGGAIWATGDLDIRNSTITGNESAGIQSNGGGLYYSGDRQGLTISNSTIIDNQAGGVAGGILYSPDMAMQKSDLTLISTVLADNDNDSFLLINDGFGHEINVIQSVFGDISAEINGSNVANIFNDSPEFDSLDDNGCFKPAGIPGEGECPQTYMPDTGSVVLDAGDNPNSEISDQRGLTYPRTFNSVTDIGAIEVSPEPSITTSVASFDFGTIVFDPQITEVTDSFAIESGGPGILHIVDINDNSSALDTEDDCELQLPAGDTCTVTVIVNLDVFGDLQREVEIISDTPGSPTVIPVSFNLITGAELQASPAMIEFEDSPVNTPSPIETLVLTNIGSQPLEFFEFEISFSGQPEFAIVGDDCGQPVPAQASCSVDLQFTPSAVGIQTSQLRIRSNSVEPFAFDGIPLRGSSGIVFIDGFE